MQNYGIILKWQRKFNYQIFKNRKIYDIMEKKNIKDETFMFFSSAFLMIFLLFSIISYSNSTLISPSHSGLNWMSKLPFPFLSPVSPSPPGVSSIEVSAILISALVI